MKIMRSMLKLDPWTVPYRTHMESSMKEVTVKIPIMYLWRPNDLVKLLAQRLALCNIGEDDTVKGVHLQELIDSIHIYKLICLDSGLIML